MKSIVAASTLALSTWSALVTAIDVTWDDDSSVKDAASTIAYGLMKYYTGNETGDTPGNLPDPYFWWEAGAMFGTLIDYWWLTGDSTYNNVTTQAMLHQVGKDEDFMPTNQTRTEGNDDQGFWAMAAMSAAEHNFPNPPSDQPQWLALVQAVFNEYVNRWDTTHCDGGMRWQIFTFNSGYDYKNTISNGCFFNIAARLARYTGNDTYADWAAKVFEWEETAGLITDTYNIYDGATIGDTNCSRIDSTEWTYNAGIFIHGASVMYNMTSSDEWKGRLDGMLNATTARFFKNDVMYEVFCELAKTCDNDQQSFKGYFARWLAATTQMAPYTYSTIYPLLKSSAEAAVAVCTGSPGSTFSGISGTACGFSWLTSTFDNIVGVGPQMNALSAVMYTLIGSTKVKTPVTADTGGTSKGNPSAGKQDESATGITWEPVTTGDKAGAAILTMLMLSGLGAGTVFVLLD